MRSGNSMTTCCVVNANILNTLINLDNSKHCSRAINRLSEGRKIHVLSHSIDYPVPLSPSSCSPRNTKSSSFLCARQIARNQRLSKKFPTKKHGAIPMTRGRDERLTMPKGFGAFMVNQCAVLWCGRNLWVATAHSNLPCFALCRKTTPNKQRTAKPYKNEFSPGYREQATTDPSSRKHNLFLYSCLYFYVLTAILNFSSKLAVIYAPSLGCQWAS